MDYNTLTGAKSVEGSIRNWANNVYAPASTILEEAQAFIYQTLRVREMRSPPTPVTLVGGAISAALPSDFLDPIKLVDNQGQRIALRHEADMPDTFQSLDQYGAQAVGAPMNYAIYGESMQFDASPKATIALSLVYYRSLPLLSNDAPTNFLTRRYPHVLRRACMIGVWEFLKDQAKEEAAKAVTLALLQELSQSDDLARRSEDAATEVRF